MNHDKNLDAQVIEEEERLLAKEALKILQDSEKTEMMKMAAAKRSEAFSVACYVERLMDLINKA